MKSNERGSPEGGETPSPLDTNEPARLPKQREAELERWLALAFDDEETERAAIEATAIGDDDVAFAAEAQAWIEAAERARAADAAARDTGQAGDRGAAWGEANENAVRYGEPASRSYAEGCEPLGANGHRPGSDSSNPGSDGSKPGSDGSKPGSDGSKPGSDGSKPGSDGSKPGEPVRAATEVRAARGTPAGDPSVQEPIVFRGRDRLLGRSALLAADAERPAGRPRPPTAAPRPAAFPALAAAAAVLLAVTGAMWVASRSKTEPEGTVRATDDLYLDQGGRGPTPADSVHPFSRVVDWSDAHQALGAGLLPLYRLTVRDADTGIEGVGDIHIAHPDFETRWTFPPELIETLPPSFHVVVQAEFPSDGGREVVFERRYSRP